MKYIQLLVLFNGMSCLVFGQENTVTSGGSVSNATGSVSYTIGQVFYSSAEGENGSINQGVQQPYTAEIITGIELREITLQLFPNPTSELAILKVEPELIGLLSFSMYDESGRLILSSPMNNLENPIQLSGNSSGIYFLNVLDSSQVIKSFRIIKTQ
jgi:hypothetical protein